MKYENTLRWLDPYGGWGNHSSYSDSKYKKTILNNDTGLANRIFHWEVAYEINKRNNFKYRILLMDTEWPELDLIDLPFTSPYFFSEHMNQFQHVYETQKLEFVSLFDTENNKITNISDIDHNHIEQIFMDDDYQLEENNYYSNFGFRTLRDLYLVKNPNFYHHLPNFIPRKRPLKKIKLKHNFIQWYIQHRAKDFVGLHLRRFNGVNIDKKAIDTLPNDLQKKYIELNEYKDVKDGTIDFYQDILYFNIIDNILKVNEHQRFYIATDLPEQMISNYKERYGDTIITKKDFEVKIQNFLLESNVDVGKLNNFGNVINNLIDLFCLSYSKMLIEVPKSSWSEFARDYRKKESFYITDGLVDIIEGYKKIY